MAEVIVGVDEVVGADVVESLVFIGAVVVSLVGVDVLKEG